MKELEQAVAAAVKVVNTLTYEEGIVICEALVQLQQRLAAHQQIKQVKVYENGIAEIIYADGDYMLIDDVVYKDAILTGYDEDDLGKKG